MNIINIPYISQWDTEASRSKNDCMSVSLAMILRSFGEKFTADQIFDKTGAGQGYITFQQLINVASSLGYKAEYKSYQSVAYLKSLIDQGITPIVLVQYGKLKSVQDTGFKGPHGFVLTGYRDDGYFVHDPNFWGNLRGDGINHFFTKEEFESAWSSTTSDGNAPRCVLVVYPKQGPATSPSPSPSLSDQDKKDIESMKKLREYNNVWYEAKHVVQSFEDIKKERDHLGSENSRKDDLLKKWESKFNTFELNAELRLKSELEKAEIDCQTSLKEQANNNLLEHEKELTLLRDKIDELENREPTKIIYRETPLEERFAEKTLSEKVIAILEIISARKK